MPKFRFAVRSPEGKLRTGTVTEATLDAAKERLKSAGLLIVTLTEESELVVHQSKGPGSAATPRPERAAIIEFEVTAGERVMAWLGRYVLRKEFALVLFLTGFAWVGYQIAHREKPPAPVEIKYINQAVEVQVDPGAFQGETYRVVLPDIPLRFDQKASEGNLLKVSYEAAKQPGRVQVTLTDLTGETVAEGEGLLSSRGEGVLAGNVALAAVKKKKTP